MARPPTPIDALVREAMGPLVERACHDVARLVAELAAAELAKRLERGKRLPVSGARGLTGRPMTRWVADRRARRVPNVVIDLTGLKTKKQIVARYGVGMV